MSSQKAVKKTTTTRRAKTNPRVSRSKRAGIQFSVSRVMQKLKNSGLANRYGQGSAVFLAAVLEYLTAEVLELAGNAARDNKKTRINPRHILLATKNDEELAKLLQHCTIRDGGVIPAINAVLLPSIKANQKGLAISSTAEKKQSTEKKASSKKAASTSSSGGVVWQYKDGGWHNYAAEASKLVEQEYQEYNKNPGHSDLRSVKSGDWHYLVDFVNMKQTNIDHDNHTRRDIRRIAP